MLDNVWQFVWVTLGDTLNLLYRFQKRNIFTIIRALVLPLSLVYIWARKKNKACLATATTVNLTTLRKNTPPYSLVWNALNWWYEHILLIFLSWKLDETVHNGLCGSTVAYFLQYRHIRVFKNVSIDQKCKDKCAKSRERFKNHAPGIIVALKDLAVKRYLDSW